MKRRYFNLIMLVAAAVGGFIGFVLGELIVKGLQYVVPNVVLVGLYFSVFATCVLASCCIAEMLFPRIAGVVWHERFKTKSFLLGIPAVLVVFFGVGCLFQFIYSLGTVKEKAIVPPEDFCFVVDCSGSMYGDRNEATVAAMHEMIDDLEEGRRASLITFDADAELQLGLQNLTSSYKTQFKNKVDETVTADGGGTNITNALESAKNMYDTTPTDGRQKSIVLVSDGIDYIDVDTIISKLNEKQISVFVIGIGMGIETVSTYEKIADSTGGRYYDAQSPKQLSFVFDNIANNVNDSGRLLIDHRYSNERSSVYYTVLRIILITLIGVLMGAALGFLFDNKGLIRNFIIGGAVTGLLAGITIEFGCQHYWNISFVRYLSDFFLSLVISLFSGVIAYEKDAEQAITTFSNGSSFDELSRFNNSQSSNDFLGRF